MTDIELLRHTLATLAYRAAKTMRGAPEDFATFKPAPDANTPMTIVSHMGNLIDWAGTMISGQPEWNEVPQADWQSACGRLFDSLQRLDAVLASNGCAEPAIAQMFQGPIADALTHTGQLALLRRLHGTPMKGESYNRADIQIGRVGFEQMPADPQYEFD